MAIADVPFDILAVKLAVPLSRPGMVGQADVIARLCASRSRLVTVVAPAGYGKTTLLARVGGAGTPRPFAWVSVDEADEYPVVFLGHVAVALDRIERVGPAGVRGGQLTLSFHQRHTGTGQVARLGSALSFHEDPGVRAGPGRPFRPLLIEPLVMDAVATIRTVASPPGLADGPRGARAVPNIGLPPAPPAGGRPGFSRSAPTTSCSARPRCSSACFRGAGVRTKRKPRP